MSESGYIFTRWQFRVLVLIGVLGVIDFLRDCHWIVCSSTILFAVFASLFNAMSLVNLNLSLNTDRTVNKIAFCSAVVAGFAYVGYSVCRTAFSRRRRGRRDDDESPRRSVFLRRLSQTTQTDGFLGEFVTDGPNKIVLRPKSVQERIRDLNMQARQFASAVTAIQSNSNGSSHNRVNGVSGRSLQVKQQFILC